MKKIMMILAALTVVCSAGCAQNKKNMGNSKTLVVYFSATGTTERVAQAIAGVVSGETLEIVPATPYSSADLDWTDKQSRSSVEMADPTSRPAIKNAGADLSGYDTVYIGWPIWWNLAPTVVNTFIESHDLSGKTIIPFATSGGSGISNSVTALKKAYPELNWKDGRLVNTPEAARSWLKN